MTTKGVDPPGMWTPFSMRINGGAGAPAIARRSVLSELSGELNERWTFDVGLLVSELVSNSVRHANVGPTQTLTVELTRLEDRIRIAVTDHGSRLEPRLRLPIHATSDGYGLFLVDKLSADWGVTRDPIGTTRVWCELMLEPGTVNAPN